MRAIEKKVDLIAPNPIFQHSNIPVPHDIRLWQCRWFLTWPRGLGFQCQNQHWVNLLPKQKGRKEWITKIGRSSSSFLLSSSAF
jgi:hypothetical protein